MGWRRLLFTSARASLALALPVATALLPSPGTALAQSRAGAASLERGRRDLPKIALTFDGAGDAGESARILAVLAQREVTATFFLTGEYIRRNPDLVRGIAAAGHEIANHTWSHPHLTAWDRTHRHTTLAGLDAAFLQRELERTSREYEAITGRTMTRQWRAPYGEVNAELLSWAAAAGWRHVGWTRDDAGGRRTLDSLDWVTERSSRNYLSSEQITERILSFGAGGAGLNGGIVLMHLSTGRDDPEVTRLGGLIDALRENGYRVVTVAELRHDLLGPADPVALTAALQR